MRREHKRVWCIGLALSGSVLPALCAWIWLPRDRDLLSQAQRVAPLDSSPRFGAIVVVGWLNADQVLAYCSVGPYVSINTRTGVRTPLSALNRLLPRHGPVDPMPRTLSPDRRWLLCSTTWYVDPRREEWYAARVDGSKLVSWFREGESDWEWEPDGRGGYGLDYPRPQVLRWSQDRPAHVTTIPAPATTLPLSLAGVVPEGLLLYNWADAGAGKPLQLVYLRFDRTAFVTRERTLPIPHGGYVIGVKVSPSGKRMAWLVRFTVAAARRTWLQRYLPQFGRRPGDYAAMWVGSTDGSDMRELGCVREWLDGHTRAFVGDWDWLPDSRSLWFQFQEAVWRVNGG